MERLSPELVLVSAPEEAAAARASLPEPAAPSPRRPRPRPAALVAVYATCVALTATPVALLTLRDSPAHAKRPPARHATR